MDPTLIALLAALSLPIQAEEPYYTAKIKPVLSIRVEPKEDATKPYRYTVSGFLQRSGVERTRGCRGRVSIRIRRGDTTVAKGGTAVRSDCRYSKSLTLSTLKLREKDKRGGPLRITGRFGGNAVLQSDAAPQRKATFGNVPFEQA